MDMRRIIFVAIISLLSAGLLLFAGSSNVGAEDLSPDQAEQVKTNCVSIKSSLGQLHASDALLRVNRGQVYESMASKLRDNFNSRLAGNRLDNKAMTTVTSKYRTTLDTFRADYIKYEQKLSSAIRIDCSTQPNSFHDAVSEARVLRAVVHDDVKKLNRLIEDYLLSLWDFLFNFERLAR